MYTVLSVKKIFREIKDVASYRGGSGHWSYILHRLTGVGVMLFLFTHIADTALLGWGPDVFNKVMSIYRHPFFRVNEVFLFAAVLYHALNGIRIIVIDFWPGATRHHKRLSLTVWILFGVLMIPAAVLMMIPVFRGSGR